jgi:hypothetical protein
MIEMDISKNDDHIIKSFIKMKDVIFMTFGSFLNYKIIPNLKKYLVK